jgi:hypothetical protein
MMFSAMSALNPKRSSSSYSQSRSRNCGRGELKTARARALQKTAMTFFNSVCEKPAQAFSVVVQLGGAKSIRTDERKSGDVGGTSILLPLDSRKRQVIWPNTSARGHI